MSWRARQVIEEIDRRWAEGQRVGKIHPWERSRILAGDYGAILREFKPDFSKGQAFVLSWSRTRAVAVRDRVDPLTLTGEVIQATKSPLLEITVTDIRRRKQGGWRVRFDVVDRRERLRLVRRKPPSRTQEDYVEPTPEEIAQASIDSAYTSDPRAAVDHREAVPEDDQNVLTMQAHSRFTEAKRKVRLDEENARDLQRVNAELKELTIRAVKMGLDPVQVLAPVVREISQQHRSLSKAA